MNYVPTKMIDAEELPGAPLFLAKESPQAKRNREPLSYGLQAVAEPENLCRGAQYYKENKW